MAQNGIQKGVSLEVVTLPPRRLCLLLLLAWPLPGIAHTEELPLILVMGCHYGRWSFRYLDPKTGSALKIEVSTLN